VYIYVGIKKFIVGLVIKHSTNPATSEVSLFTLPCMIVQTKPDLFKLFCLLYDIVGKDLLCKAGHDFSAGNNFVMIKTLEAKLYIGNF